MKPVLNIVLTSFLLGILIPVQAQFNPEKQASNKIKKKQWSLVRKTLNKSLQKDSTNIEALYVYSLLYFTPGYSRFNLDTANFYRIKTSNLFNSTDHKARERLKKFPIDSLLLKQLGAQIDSAAFERAKRLDTEASYNHFLDFYGHAIQTRLAIELRDEAAFGDALKENTYGAFRDFLRKYPQSHRAGEAQKRFDKLLFESYTRNKTLDEYRQFIRLYPTSPYHDVAAKSIYEISTLGGSEKSFEAFIHGFPWSAQAKEASNLLLHIRLAKQAPFTLNDSLRKIYPVRDWLPFFDSSKWGFLDETGKSVFAPTLKSIDSRYACEPLADDFIITEEGIIARNGVSIYRGRLKTITDLGTGFIKCNLDSSAIIIHKSGKKIDIPKLTDAVILGFQFIGYRNNALWGLYSLTGFEILPCSFEQIQLRGQFLILTKNGKEILVSLDNVVAFAQGKYEPVVADEIRRFSNEYFWVRNGALEKIMDENLKEVVPFDRQAISFTSVGLVIKKNNLQYLKDWPGLNSTPLEEYRILEPWVITRASGEKPSLHFIPNKQTIAKDIDSIWFDQQFAVIMKNDSVRLLQSAAQSFLLPIQEKYTIRKSKDSVVFILVRSNSKTSIHYANTFEKIMTTTWPEVEPVLRNVFLIKDKGKLGLIDDKNKVLLKPEYDAILFSNGLFTLLKDKKFGTYDPVSRKIIKPTFESNLVNYNQEWIIGRKDNKLAFIKFDGVNQSNFDFDEVEFWSDSIALVKLNGKKLFYSIADKKIILDNIGTVQIITELPNEKLAILSRGKFHGLVGTKSGIILKPEYDELTYQIVNNTLILMAMRVVNSKEALVTYFSERAKVLREIKTDLDTAYTILCAD